MTIKKSIEKLGKEVKQIKKRIKKLEVYKQDKKIYGHEKGKPVFKEDIAKCKRCGKFFLYCKCKG